MMLENAEKVQRAFERLRVNDAQYIRYFLDDGSGEKILGPLDFEDWDNVKVFVKFLKLFYEILKLSTTAPGFHLANQKFTNLNLYLGSSTTATNIIKLSFSMESGSSGRQYDKKGEKGSCSYV